MLRTAFVVSPGFQMMSFAAMSVFEMANYTAGKELYDIHLLSESGGAVPSSLGMPIETKRFRKQSFDTLIVGGLLAPTPSSNGLLSFLRNALPVTRRIASICTGALILAEAGLLDGRRATTHWLIARDLQARFPKVRMEEDRIFIIDGPIWTSAGMTSGVDLALGMLEKDFGTENGAVGCSKAGRLPPTCGRSVPALSAPRARCKVRPNSKCARLRQTESPDAALGRAACGSRAPQPTPIQPRLSR
jgi:transcriptional regulator GlxA family with amidase domain